MNDVYLSHLRGLVEGIRADGFYKTERVITSPQSPSIRLAHGKVVLNFCANNYLGLADDPRLIVAAKDGLDAYGFGMASVRFIWWSTTADCSSVICMPPVICSGSIFISFDIEPSFLNWPSWFAKSSSVN